MSQLLVAQRALTVPGWAKDALWRSARAVPSLDLRFAENKSLVDATSGSNLVTFTRASSGTFVDSAGVIQTAVTDVPRFDHNPTTGESLGLLVEEQRTNSIRNNTMVGAVAGTPGTLPTNWAEGLAGLTRDVVGIGTTNGITWIDLRFSGTSTSTVVAVALEGVTTATASAGQNWTNSFWIARVGGSTTNVTGVNARIRSYSSTPSFLGQQDGSAITLTSSLVRHDTTYSNLPATTAFVEPVVRMVVANSAAIDITLRIGLPQLEQGAFATSVIPTTTATVTRSADVCSISGSNFSAWYRADEGSFYAENQLPPGNPPASTFPGVLSANNGTTTNQMMMYWSSTTVGRWFVRESGTITADVSASAVTAGSSTRMAVRYASNDAAISANGGAIGSDTSVVLPTADRLTIGAQAFTAPLNGTIRRLTYWGQRLPNNVLQQITQ